MKWYTFITKNKMLCVRVFMYSSQLSTLSTWLSRTTKVGGDQRSQYLKEGSYISFWGEVDWWHSSLNKWLFNCRLCRKHCICKLQSGSDCWENMLEPQAGVESRPRSSRSAAPMSLCHREESTVNHWEGMGYMVITTPGTLVRDS